MTYNERKAIIKQAGLSILKTASRQANKGNLAEDYAAIERDSVGYALAVLAQKYMLNTDDITDLVQGIRSELYPDNPDPFNKGAFVLCDEDERPLPSNPATDI